MSAIEWGPWGPMAPANLRNFQFRAKTPVAADVTFTVYLDGVSVATQVLPEGASYRQLFLGFPMQPSQVLVLGADDHEGTEITAILSYAVG